MQLPNLEQHIKLNKSLQRNASTKAMNTLSSNNKRSQQPEESIRYMRQSINQSPVINYNGNILPKRNTQPETKSTKFHHKRQSQPRQKPTLNIEGETVAAAPK